MTIFQMLEQSVNLTLLGMGIVFAFLVILVICVTLTGKIIHALGADKDINPNPAGASGPAPDKSAAVTAAISAAVNEYRKSN